MQWTIKKKKKPSQILKIISNFKLNLTRLSYSLMALVEHSKIKIEGIVNSV